MTNIFGEVLRINYEAKVLVPSDLVGFLNEIHRNIANPSWEFGVYLKGDFDPENAAFIIRPGNQNRYVPRQTVGPAHLAFTEGPDSPSWNCALHRHPSGVRSFSGTDRDSINQDWDCSVLFIPPHDFPAAIINIDLSPTARFQVPARVIVVPSDEDQKFMASLRDRIRGNGPTPMFGEHTIADPGEEPGQIERRPLMSFARKTK